METNPLKKGLRALVLLGASGAVMVGLVLLVNASRYGVPGVLAGFLLMGSGAGAAWWAFSDARGRAA